MPVGLLIITLLWRCCVTRETDKLSSHLGKYPSFLNQLGIGLFNWVSVRF